MHEVSIAEGILSAVESTLVNEPDAKVSSVTVNIGELAGVESQALLFAWDSVVRGTLAEGAKLVIEQVAGEAWCMKCAKNVPLHRHGDPCPECGSFQLLATQGHELKVLDIEIPADAPQKTNENGA